jgi:5-methylcytosine-specific restriction endonuclease McrA
VLAIAMTHIDLITAVAQTDSTYRLVDGEWIGKCLICNGPLRFDARTGGGATLEHILPRSAGGSDTLLNLGLTHAKCNYEKGVHWDEPKRRRGRHKEYEALVTRLLTRRRARWREAPGTG